jgi:hypothetical protein
MTVGVFLYLVFWVMMGLVGGRIAAHRGYSPLLGIAVGILLGPVWLALALLVPRRRSVVEMEEADSLRGGLTTCATCGQSIPSTSNECPRCIYRKAFPSS